MHNMGVVFLRINHPEDAAASFEYIMAEKPTFKTGLHLVVSNYMSGDPERTKRSFRELLEIPLDIDEDEEKYTTVSVSQIDRCQLNIVVI
jgi:intraflagellar transport protein 88